MLGIIRKQHINKQIIISITLVFGIVILLLSRTIVGIVGSSEYLIATDDENIYLITSSGDIIYISKLGILSTLPMEPAKEIYNNPDGYIDVLTNRGTLISTRPSTPQEYQNLLSNSDIYMTNTMMMIANSALRISKVENATHVSSRYPYYCLSIYHNGKVKMTGVYENGVADEVAYWNNIQDIICLGDGMYVFGLTDCGDVLYTSSYQYPFSTELDDWENISKLYGGGVVIGVMEDGTVRASTQGTFGEGKVTDWTDIVSISASWYHTVGLKSDGTVVACGLNNNGQCEVSNWKNIIAITTSNSYTVGVDKDGIIHVAGKGFENVEFEKFSTTIRKETRLFQNYASDNRIRIMK